MKFEAVNINDNIKGLFSEERRQNVVIPETHPFIYDVRHGDDGNPCSIEKFVFVNHYGTLFTQEELDFKGEDYIDIEEFSYEDLETSIR